MPSAWAAAISSSMLTAPGASVAGASVGASVAASVGASVGASVITSVGASVAAGGASVVAPPPHAANREANTSNVAKLNNSFLIFILFSPLGLVSSATRSLLPALYYWISLNTMSVSERFGVDPLKIYILHIKHPLLNGEAVNLIGCAGREESGWIIKS